MIFGIVAFIFVNIILMQYWLSSRKAVSSITAEHESLIKFRENFGSLNAINGKVTRCGFGIFYPYYGIEFSLDKDEKLPKDIENERLDYQSSSLANIEYEYSINGENFVANRIGPISSSYDLDLILKNKSTMKVGSAIKIYVNPEIPEDCFLRKPSSSEINDYIDNKLESVYRRRLLFIALIIFELLTIAVYI